MLNTKWFNDVQAKQAHDRMDEHLKRMCAELFPSHLFSHSGWNRNEITDEVTIKLHLRPIGEVRQIHDRLNLPDSLRLERE